VENSSGKKNLKKKRFSKKNEEKLKKNCTLKVMRAGPHDKPGKRTLETCAGKTEDQQNILKFSLLRFEKYFVTGIVDIILNDSLLREWHIGFLNLFKLEDNIFVLLKSIKYFFIFCINHFNKTDVIVLNFKL